MKRLKTILDSHYLRELRLLRENVPSFDEYPFNLPVIRTLETLHFHPKVTYIIGENGSGKSTLLEALAVAWGYNAEGGDRDIPFSTNSTHSDLYLYLRLVKGPSKAYEGFFLRAESFYNVATVNDNLGRSHKKFGGLALHEQSHGESFFSLFMHGFTGNGVYFLDEPEAALSPMRQMAMLTRLHQLIGMQSQFIIATHSPIVMAYPDAQILLLSEDGIREVAYEETEHFFVTREFLANREKMLRILLKE